MYEEAISKFEYLYLHSELHVKKTGFFLLKTTVTEDRRNSKHL